MVIFPKKDKSTWNNLKDFTIKNAIFLAGSCPVDNEKDWRDDAIKYLESKNKDIVILNPTNSNYDENNNLEMELQTKWEYEAMMYASVIVFWIPRDEKHLCLTTNVEFGTWLNQDKAYVIGWPETAIKQPYFIERLKMINKEYYSTLEDTLDMALVKLNRGESTYFTSDTHFGQQRTLEYSKRPFRTVEEMDLTLISNWNKTVTNNDTVVHAGDFGDIDNLVYYLNHLNFKELHWVFGNYDREKEKGIHKILKENNFTNVKCYDSLRNFAQFYLPENNTLYIVLHEPVIASELTKNQISQREVKFSKEDIKKYNIKIDSKIPTFYLYGHIHGRAFAKKNGIDLACDYHRYTPISASDIVWFTNARQYWDENVFTTEVK